MNTYNKLVFIMHKKCNASCSLCCFNSNPACHEKLEVGRVKEYINQSAYIPDIKSVSFTGGEPFLEYRTLLELVKYATERGKKVSTITNGFWATTYEKAYHRLKELKKNGLLSINISHDHSHQQYVNTSFVKNILLAALHLNLETTLVMVATKNEKMGDIVDELGCGLYGTNLAVSPCLPVGAAGNYADVKFDRMLETSNLHCIYGGNLAIGYDGTIFPCCSQFIYEFGLGLGNYQQVELADVLRRVQNNALLYLLRNEKLDFFVDIARNRLHQSLPERVVNACELCALLFKKELVPLYRPYVMEKIQSLKQEVTHA